WAMLQDWLTRHNCTLRTATGELDLEDPTSEFMFNILASVGRMEARLTSARATSARKELVVVQARQAGVSRTWPFTTAPNPSGKGVVLRPIPERAEVIRQIADNILDGASIRSQTQWLNRTGIPPTRGAQWTTQTLKMLLLRPALAGGAQYRGEVVRNEDGTMRIDPDQAILSMHTWLRLKALIEGRKSGYSPPGKPSLLQGVLRCSSCKSLLTFKASADHYRCPRAECSRQVSVRRDIAEQEYLDHWLPMAEGADVLSEVDEGPDPVEVARLTEALDNVEEELRDTDDETYAMTLLADRKRLREELRALQDTSRATPVVVRGVRVEPHRTRTMSQADAYRQATTIEEQNAVLRQYGPTAWVQPGLRGRITVRLSFEE